MISCKAFVWTQENPTANLRESPRIAFSLRSGALLRLIAYAGIAPSLEKCCWKNPRAGFSVVSLFFLITQKEKFTERKTGTPVFPTAFFQTACDSCVGDQPKQSTTVQEKCDSRKFAEIRG